MEAMLQDVDAPKKKKNMTLIILVFFVCYNFFLNHEDTLKSKNFWTFIYVSLSYFIMTRKRKHDAKSKTSLMFFSACEAMLYNVQVFIENKNPHSSNLEQWFMCYMYWMFAMVSKSLKINIICFSLCQHVFNFH